MLSIILCLLFLVALNTRVVSTTKKSPFMIVFGQTPNTLEFDESCVDEENIEHLLSSKIDVDYVISTPKTRPTPKARPVPNPTPCWSINVNLNDTGDQRNLHHDNDLPPALVDFEKKRVSFCATNNIAGSSY